jgi:hypothetical protein
MKAIKARVINGRLIVDEPSEFPEGTELDLTVAADTDELSDEERAALHKALRASWRSAQAGELKPARDLLDKLGSSE